MHRDRHHGHGQQTRRHVPLPPTRSAASSSSAYRPTTPTTRAPYVSVRLSTSWMSKSRCRRIAMAMVTGSATLTAVRAAVGEPPAVAEHEVVGPDEQQAEWNREGTPDEPEQLQPRLRRSRCLQPATHGDGGAEEQQYDEHQAKSRRAGPTRALGATAAAAPDRRAPAGSRSSSPAAPDQEQRSAGQPDPDPGPPAS